MLRVDRRKKRVHVASALRAADEKQPGRPEREMEDVEDLVLRFRIQIDEQVPAGYEVQIGERRIAQQIRRRRNAAR